MLTMQKVQRWFKSFFDFRLLLLIGPASYMLATDMPVFKTLLYSISAMLLIVGVAHWLRQVVMHYVELGDLIDSARRDPMASAVVVLAVCLFMSVLVGGMIWWVRG